MDAHSTSTPANDPVVGTVLHDPHGDEVRAEHQPHDPADEIQHAWEHFWENVYFFSGFLSVIVLTVIAFNVDFGTWNQPVTYLLAALRSALIAYFLSTLFRNFSFVFRTLFFTLLFLGGMIFLSLWDSEIRGIGNPIRDMAHPEHSNIR